MIPDSGRLDPQAAEDREGILRRGFPDELAAGLGLDDFARLFRLRLRGRVDEEVVLVLRDGEPAALELFGQAAALVAGQLQAEPAEQGAGVVPFGSSMRMRQSSLMRRSSRTS